MSSSGLDYMLLLYLEGGKNYGQGGYTSVFRSIIKSIIKFLLFLMINAESFSSGGLFYCYLSLHHVGGAAGTWTDAARSNYWYQILPLPRSFSSHRPTGTKQQNKVSTD